MLAVVLAILAKTVVNLKLGLGSISKKNNKSHIFKHLHSTAIRLDSYNSLCLKIIDKANSKFDLKIKIVLHINWRKPNLNPQKTHLALTFFTIVSVPLFCSFLSLFVLFYRFSLLFVIIIISDTNYLHLLLSLLYFAVTSFDYNTPCVTSFSFIYCFHFLYANYRDLLLS